MHRCNYHWHWIIIQIVKRYRTVSISCSMEAYRLWNLSSKCIDTDSSIVGHWNKSYKWDCLNLWYSWWLDAVFNGVINHNERCHTIEIYLCPLHCTLTKSRFVSRAIYKCRSNNDIVEIINCGQFLFNSKLLPGQQCPGITGHGFRDGSLQQDSVLLQWCHNELDGVSNHQPRDCLLNHLFRQRKQKSSTSLSFVRGIHR